MLNLILYSDFDSLLYGYHKKLTYCNNSDHETDCNNNINEENLIYLKIHIPTSIVSTLNHIYYEICPHSM